MNRRSGSQIIQKPQKSAAIVRTISTDDYTGWRRLFDAYLVFYETELTNEQIDLTWGRLLNQEDGMLGLIACDEAGNAAGIANLVFHRSTWAKNHYCYLEDLYVGHSARGEGFGRVLIEAACAEAVKRGASRTYWATHRDNAAARRLYDRVATLTPFLQYER